MNFLLSFFPSFIPRKIIKFFPTICAGIVILFSVFSMSYAQQTPSSYAMPNTDANVPQNLHTLTQGLVLDLLSAATCQLSGVDFTTQNHKCLSYNSQTGKLGYADSNGGVIGFLGSSLQIMYTAPIHTSYYVAYLKDNFGITKTAQAAGNSGFDQLQPLTKIWIMFRNLAYLLYVVIFVVIGFAIMLRAKIDPRTVMTIENQIPKLIVSILLITFSFAIAGLLIDFLWTIMYIIVNIFASVDPSLSAGNIVSGFQEDPFHFFGRIQDGSIFGYAVTVAGAVSDMLNSIIGSSLAVQLGPVPIGPILSKFIAATVLSISALLPCLPSLIIGQIPGSNTDFGKCIDNNVTAQLSFVGAIIAYLIILVAMVIALFKIWFTLIQSYAMFLILAATGPLFILAGVLPGSKITFEWWLKQLVAYLSSFVVTLGILLLAKVIVDAFGTSANAFVPPLIGGQAGKIATSTLGAIIGFAAFLLVPQALTMSRDAIGAAPIKYLQGIGEGMGAGTKFVGGVANAGWHRAFHERNLQTGQGEGFGTRLFLGHVDESNTWSGTRIQQFLRSLAYGKMKGMK